MYFRIMSKWFKMSNTFYSICYCFFVYNIPLSKFDIDIKTFFDQTF